MKEFSQNEEKLDQKLSEDEEINTNKKTELERTNMQLIHDTQW